MRLRAMYRTRFLGDVRRMSCIGYQKMKARFFPSASLRAQCVPLKAGRNQIPDTECVFVVATAGIE